MGPGEEMTSKNASKGKSQKIVQDTESKEKKILLTPIQTGTAIDHLNPGTAIKILEVLEIPGNRVSAGMNVDSRKMGKKDLVFIEGKKLSEEEISKIALLGHGATINIIENSRVIKKEKIEVPNQVRRIIKCINPLCITNKEGVATKFSVSTHPISAKCFYCETNMSEREIISAIVV